MPVKEKKPQTAKTSQKRRVHKTASAKKEQQRKRQKKLTVGEKRGAQTLAAILLVAGVIYLLAVMIIALFVWYSFSTPAESETLYSLRIVTEADGERKVSYTVGQANNSYGLYLRYSDLAPLCDFGIAGDEEYVTLYLPPEGQVGNEKSDSVTFCRNSSLIYVNGNPVRLSSPILFEGTDYLLPVSLFEGYLSGLDITYNEEDRLCVVTVPEKLSFSLKLHKPVEASQCDLTLFPEANTSSEESLPANTSQ